MLIELLYSAARSDYGIIVETDDVERLRQKLYPLRKTDSYLEGLSFVVSPTNPARELWIVKREVPNASND